MPRARQRALQPEEGQDRGRKRGTTLALSPTSRFFSAAPVESAYGAAIQSEAEAEDKSRLSFRTRFFFFFFAREQPCPIHR